MKGWCRTRAHNHAKVKQFPLAILCFSILFSGSLKLLVKSAEMPWFTNPLIKEMVTAFLPTPPISINTAPEECITRQIISPNKSALMIGSGGGGGCIARRRHCTSKSFSCSISSGEKTAHCPCWQGGQLTCSNSQQIKLPDVLCGRRWECYPSTFSKGDNNWTKHSHKQGIREAGRQWEELIIMEHSHAPASHVLDHSILTTTLWNRCHYCPNFQRRKLRLREVKELT